MPKSWARHGEAWLTALESGDVGSFDAWMLQTGVDGGVGDLVECRDRLLGLEVDIRPKAALKREERVAERPAGTKVDFDSSQPSAQQLTVSMDCCDEVKDVLLSFPLSQFDFADGQPHISAPGALDLYSGVGGVRRALVRGGCPWVLSFEIKRSEREDLLCPENQRKIMVLIHFRAVMLVGSAIVCRSFSIAVTPPVRNALYPRGVPWMSAAMKEKVKEGNLMSDFQAEIHAACFACFCFFWTENPDGSHLWRQRKFKKFKDSKSSNVARLDMCRFGTSWRKRTRLGTNIPDLKGFRMFCRCCGGHTPLRGQHPERKIPWTQVAQSYPRVSLGSLLVLQSMHVVGTRMANLTWQSVQGPCLKESARRPILDHVPTEGQEAFHLRTFLCRPSLACSLVKVVGRFSMPGQGGFWLLWSLLIFSFRCLFCWRMQ